MTPVCLAQFHPTRPLLLARQIVTSASGPDEEIVSLYNTATAMNGRAAFRPIFSPANERGHTGLLRDDWRRLHPRRLVARGPAAAQPRDYIKEVCFGCDGQVMASPHENGVRLLPTPAMADTGLGHAAPLALGAGCALPSIATAPVVTARSVLVAGGWKDRLSVDLFVDSAFVQDGPAYAVAGDRGPVGLCAVLPDALII